ncbi:uncharacterized protein LOC134672682 [Cydia fagiglandana]|uniref:uncharacterized protein LOC134672682 n=1 Tax=Cydia fagiglandana TaxID=1458189 RepID=UPI002FEE4CB5
MTEGRNHDDLIIILCTKALHSARFYAFLIIGACVDPWQAFFTVSTQRNNINLLIYQVEVLFYENVNNQYRRSFIELQFKFCAFIFKDPIFGAAIRNQIASIDSCPIPAGAYNLYNMTAAADHLPKLPFSKGRIYICLKTRSKPVLRGYCDMELKRKKPPKH